MVPPDGIEASTLCRVQGRSFSVPDEVVFDCVLRTYTMVVKILLLVAFMTVACKAVAQDAQCVSERAAMVETIRAYARSEASVLGPQGISERVLEAMGQTERHRFILGHFCSVAYMDGAVPIGRGQTISQPFIVALMTHLAEVKVNDTVLEVGTGSGYQAAILARPQRLTVIEKIAPSETRTRSVILVQFVPFTRSQD